MRGGGQALGLGLALALALAISLSGARAAEAEASNAVEAEGGGWAEAPPRDPKASGASLGALGRSVLTELARTFMTRSDTNSQVLSLNLTNLLILLVLKALLFGAGMFSFGLLNHKGHPGGRSSDGAEGASWLPSLSEGELLLALSFLAGDAAAAGAPPSGPARGRSSASPEPYACLRRVACERPRDARRYAGAAKMLLSGARVVDNVLPYNPRYEALVVDVQKAAEVGLSGADCGQHYVCGGDGR